MFGLHQYHERHAGFLSLAMRNLVLRFEVHTLAESFGMSPLFHPSIYKKVTQL